MQSTGNSAGTALVAVATVMTVVVFGYLLFDAATTKLPDAAPRTVSTAPAR